MGKGQYYASLWKAIVRVLLCWGVYATGVYCTFDDLIKFLNSVIGDRWVIDVDEHSIDEQQRRRRNKSRIHSISTAATDIIDTVVGTVSPTTNTTLHIIFSTDCSTYQQWQSYLFFYSAYAIGQPGYITRIVSGCNNDDDDDDDTSGGSSSSSKKKKEDEELQWHNIHVRHVMSNGIVYILRLNLVPSNNMMRRRMVMVVVSGKDIIYYHNSYINNNTCDMWIGTIILTTKHNNQPWKTHGQGKHTGGGWWGFYHVLFGDGMKWRGDFNNI